MDEPPTNKKLDIPPVPVIAQVKLSAIGRRWQLTAIICLLAIIAGIMSYNQYDSWRREKNARESKERQDRWAKELQEQEEKRRKEWEPIYELRRVQLSAKHSRQNNDENIGQRCATTKIVRVPAEVLLKFIEDQPDDSEFAPCFLSKDRFHEKDIGDPATFIKTMTKSGDLILRWALAEGGITENDIANTEYIVSGLSTISFTSRRSETIRAYRFNIDISELFPPEDWGAMNLTLKTFGSARGYGNYLSDHIDNWKREHVAEE